MSSRAGGSRLREWAVIAICWLLAVGCDGVQEDRHVAFTSSGNQVAFQHGSDGLYVADPRTGELRKVFDPDPSIIAVSTPIWSDDESQAIFTTARDAKSPESPKKTASRTKTGQPINGTPQQSTPVAWDDAPTGRLFYSQPIVYTCWLVERDKAGAVAKPVSLFEARCDHSGYVAGNLAVRWDAKRKKVLFVKRDSNLSHAVWSYDQETKRKTRVFPPAGQTAPAYVVADFWPDGSHIVCVSTGPNPAEVQPAGNSASKHPLANLSGIWIGSSEGSDWWHVVESEYPQQDRLPEGLSTLIAHRPVCTKDGRLFAFVGDEKTVKNSNVCQLFRARVADQKVERVFETAGDVRDLHWSPDGSRLGFILTDSTTSSFKTIDTRGHVQELFADRFTWEFPGWNSTGDKLACVVAEKSPPKVQPPQAMQSWALLLFPDPLARNAVLVADGKGGTHTVVSGLRFTFPQWSPKRDQLSMWGTFQPSHLALTSEMGGGLGLRRGDPACIVDVSTGAIRWLAINGDEMAQVGHYFLLKHNPAEAREWYRKADKQLPKLEPLRPADLIHGLSGAAARRRTFEFFYFHCLTTLGETKEAVERLALFDDAHRIAWPPIADSPAGVSNPKTESAERAPSDPALAWSSPKSRHEAEILVAIAKALSISQIFLSIDEPDTAQTWFTHRLESADSTERLADLMALSQLSLLAKNHIDYAKLVTDRLAPLLVGMLEDPPSSGEATTPDSPAAVRTSLAVLAAHSFGPLWSEEFLKELLPEFVGQLVPKWEAMRSQPHSHLGPLYVNLFLRAAAARLGHDKERIAAKARIVESPLSAPGLLSGQLEFYFQWLRPPAKSPQGGRL